METERLAWYCARSKAKNEHIAAANVRKNLGLEVFHPRLQVERATRRGVVRLIEPVFPGYIFVRCAKEMLSSIQRTAGISSLVHFGGGVPTITDRIIEELQECFESGELALGDEVVVGEGVLAGMRAVVLRLMPARRRVQILLDILSGPTPMEVDRSTLVLEKRA